MVLGPDFMAPEMYMGFYRNMVVTLADGSVVQVDIRKYLNHGKVIPLPDPNSKDPPKKPSNAMEVRATAANKEYWQLLAKVGQDRFRDSPAGNAKTVDSFQVPLKFQIGGEVYSRKYLYRAYMGKGSSLDIARALRLASRYRTISTEGYCDKFLGLDCTGFVCNYWGIGNTENTDHKNFDVRRRKDLASLKIGDAIVYYKGPQSSQHKSIRSVHVAVVNEVDSVVESGSEATVTMNYVESAGEEEGVHKSQTRSLVFKKNAEGELFYHTTNSARTGYLCEGPDKKRPNGF